jgi:hypothetical protein
VIDLLKEQTLSMSQAGRFAGEQLGRGPLSSAAIHRWSRKGRFGIRLEVLETPSGRITTKEAICRFFAAITAAARREKPAVQRGARRPGVEDRVARAMDTLDGGQRG